MNKKAVPAGRQGFTLIELVIAVLVVGIAFYSLISVFITAVPGGVNAEDLSKASFLANRVIEETTVKDFSSIVSVAETSFGAPFNNFSYLVQVDYVTTSEPDVVFLSPTPYKRVKVKAWGGLSGTVEVATLVTIHAH